MEIIFKKMFVQMFMDVLRLKTPKCANASLSTLDCFCDLISGPVMSGRLEPAFLLLTKVLGLQAGPPPKEVEDPRRALAGAHPKDPTHGLSVL